MEEEGASKMNSFQCVLLWLHVTAPDSKCTDRLAWSWFFIPETLVPKANVNVQQDASYATKKAIQAMI